MSLAAIVGRPNVGKSTFFNRITGTKQAITDDRPGVTRDRVYGRVDWNGRQFSVVDTGGYVPRSAERYEAAIREQVEIALDEADLVLLMVDVLTGITDLDQEMADLLRRTETPVFVVANKADNQERRWGAADFYRLGLGEVHPVSSTNGTGTGDLLDAVVEALPEAEPPVADERTRIALVGRPNVGKSSLLNALLGHERTIVTEESGTTRDAVHAEVVFEGEELVLVDTAGLRKRPKVKENIEFYAALRSERAIQESDIAVLILDATQGLEAQDQRILRQADEQKKGLVLAVNKWDLVEKDTSTMRRYEEYFRERLGTQSHVPMRFISALSGQRIYQVLEEALAVAERRRQRVTTHVLNEVVKEAVKRHHPPSYRGRHVQINYATQAEAAPPVFVFFCNYPQGLRAGYDRYLERKLREAFDFAGVSLVLKFRRK